MKIRQVILQTSGMEKLAAFYAEQMELPVTTTNDTLFIQIGSTGLVFKQAVAADPFYHFAINIPANKIEEARVWLIKNNIALLRIQDYKSDIADFVNWHAKSVYFIDPTGNIVELIARADLNNSTPQLFSSRQLLSVSEIGIVAKETEMNATANTIRQQYDLDWFDKQPPLPQFKVIGDDEGLFILVPEKRNWYPTTTPSDIFPMEIRFSNNGVDRSVKF